MTAQHFKELVETIQITKKLTNAQIAKILKISPTTLWFWKKHGVTDSRVRTSCKRLRDYMRGEMA